MAVSIDWATGVISVPKADMLLVQASPVEIRELNLDTFRLTLKDLEDDEDGLPFPDTHVHYPSVTVSGVQLAKVIIILDPYTITFEDGQYAVNLVGANSNVGDKVNVNQVSVRSGNSAGLIQTREIEYSSFNGGVTIDTVNGTSGTSFPIGTPAYPVNNLADAKFIAGLRGFYLLYIKGNITIGSGDNVDGYIVKGDNCILTVVTLEDGCSTDGVEFRDCRMLGVLNGTTRIYLCHVGDLTWVRGVICESLIDGDLTLAGDQPVYLINCNSGFSDTPNIDMGGSGRSLIIRDYAGEMILENFAGDSGDFIIADFESGQITIEPSVTDGTIIIRGIVNVINNGSADVDTSMVVSAETIKSAIEAGDLASIITKLPDNYIMGSSNKLNQNGYLSSIMMDTQVIIPDMIEAVHTIADSIYGNVDILLAFVRNKKYLIKTGVTWYLHIRNDNDTDDILKKELKDKDGNDIDDIVAGKLAQELKSLV